MAKKIEVFRVGILGEEPLLSMDALYKTRDAFLWHFGKEANQLRMSPEAFNDLRAMAERTSIQDPNNIMGMKPQVDYEMEDHKWYVCIEEEKVYDLGDSK